ncbi:hypothetical protein [Sanguibacter antarcticus]|uniref:Uncharacterized protein n=1 Tax=Sanguibacter antarcticus TaxID=372484 RepID=A0A2A9E8S4_9MICO|nr:hypothetical protein [Sanguibacter antarcticus]PFG35056.1 hypothetical protein ATL42_2989 [Sanguibacter antarcticus]
MTRRAGAPSDAEALERSTRSWMRAYPRRWRAAFGDDLVGIQADVARPGARRVPAREAAAIVRSGWLLRLREHPPLLPWLGYRLLDRPLPPRYAHWAADDILGALWFARWMIGPTCIMLVITWLGSSDRGDSLVSPAVVGVLIGAGIGCLLTAGPLGTGKRRKGWQRHVSDEVPFSLLSRNDKRRAVRDERTA